MKTTIFLGFSLLILTFLILSVPFQSCEPDEEEKMVYKPNIYIYPNEVIDLTLKITFPMGGKIVTSIPEYGSGWSFVVDTSGLIDNTYSYLFYESIQPDVWQRNYGWCIKTDTLEIFIRQNMSEYGFNDKEINDFIEYWIPRLNDYPYYSLYPQTNCIIDDVVQLEFSKQPENILRLFYSIHGRNSFLDKLKAPTIDKFIREGYFVTEWGVIL